MSNQDERNEAVIRTTQFDRLKAEHIKRGMTREQADDAAYREIKREIWRTPTRSRLSSTGEDRE